MGAVGAVGAVGAIGGEGDVDADNEGMDASAEMVRGCVMEGCCSCDAA